MNLRLSSLRAMFARPDTGRLAVAAALALMLAGAASSSAMAAPVDAASAPDGASVSASGTAAVSSATGGQYTVRPGQSLNDVAIAVTQSHDRATLARAARALFDANPSAFMGHDPSRMRLGSVLNVPALDASGAVAASAAGPASAPTADSGSSSNAAVGSGASSAAPGNAAAASAAGGQSPATQAATSPAPAVQGSASDASPVVTSDAASSAAATAAGSQAASAASGTHVWAGSVQPSASEAAAATGASQPRAQVSSLQQLLALKNRVLMELQKHGIGKAPAAPVAPVASGTQSAGGASSAAVMPGRPGTATTTSNDTGISQTNLAIAAAVGAALVVLLTALRLGRRKRERLAQEEHAASADGIAPSGAAEQPNRVVPADEVVEPNLTDADAAAAQHAAAMAAAEREAAEGEAAAREMSERVAAEREAEIRAAASREAEARQAAERDTAQFAADEVAGVRETAQPAAEHEPSADFAASNAELSDDHAAPAEATALEQSELPPAQIHHELDAATTVASLDAAAELGADALPRAPLEPLEQVNEAWEPEPLSHRLEWDDEPLPAEPMEPLSPQPLATTAQVHDDQVDTPAQPAAADQPRVQAPADFPRDALDAFGSLDMPLPPRVESAAETVHAPESLSTQPVASQEATARQAVLPPDADEAPHAADEIAAGTAGRAAVAGLGAGNLGTAGFGALKLDFDLELPPSPAQPLPAFTPADLARIARNKLDLAAEYIELGDLAGARTLINEVIESNDPATRNDARALLSTLAPLS
ncbi:FimV/HubP family polar landmark protein [Paraburkholderia caledonica]|uniref:FimV-like protein n=1 Tax=Paraburkholderia caledonica TaxID=134536 RepID=A0ABU1L8F6_9BURK|nr:FimV/HubP family polar landmark protein [Paraburkholderia caledonica]MDR6379508.1 FimV-like protein [Paraburkholderia caledonica]